MDLPRGTQVRLDERRRPGQWLAVDDDADGWNEHQERHVLTDPVLEIAEPAVLRRLQQQLALRFLRSQP